MVEGSSSERDRLGKKQVTFLGVILALSLIAAACERGTGPAEYLTSIQCPDCPRITVSRIIDGDTFDTSRGRVRLFGVDTPERGDRCYTQAARGLEQLAGSIVRVEAGPRARDPGGRLLYYVYTESGNSIDEILVSEGLALAWTRDGQHRDRLVGLEEEARRRGAGCLW